MFDIAADVLSADFAAFSATDLVKEIPTLRPGSQRFTCFARTTRQPDVLRITPTAAADTPANSSGDVWDNAAMESFFSSLKTERTGRKIYRTRDAAKADVFGYIERFYNPKRVSTEPGAAQT
jgi:hypothetical protein